MKTIPNVILVAACMSVTAAITWWGAGANSAQAENAQASNTSSKLEQSSGSMASIKATVQKRLAEVRPELIIEKLEKSKIPGLYTAKIKNGPVLYVTADGGHFVMGDLYQVEPTSFVNIAEQAREGERAKAIASIDVKDMIVFAPKEQPSKAVINVFTDVDCYYCQKLHSEVVDLNRAGIEVRYLAFPRAGIGSESYEKIASAWCASNQQDAMNKLKRRQDIERNVCNDNPVKDQYTLGQQIGVTGTPALITDKGKLMPGYMPTLRLAQALDVAVSPELSEELLAKMQAQSRQ